MARINRSVPRSTGQPACDGGSISSVRGEHVNAATCPRACTPESVRLAPTSDTCWRTTDITACSTTCCTVRSATRARVSPSRGGNAVAASIAVGEATAGRWSRGLSSCSSGAKGSCLCQPQNSVPSYAIVSL